MNTPQPHAQTGPSALQPGQDASRARQSSQDSRFGANLDAPGQKAAQQGQDRGQDGRSVASAGPAPGREAGQAASGATLMPPVDIFEDENGFLLLADMPGVSREQLVVRVTGDNLVIEGAATVPVTGTMELVYGEVQSPQYRRSFTLSRELDPGKIEATLNNGVLTLRIPKAEEARPRRIEVTVG